MKPIKESPPKTRRKFDPTFKWACFDKTDREKGVLR